MAAEEFATPTAPPTIQPDNPVEPVNPDDWKEMSPEPLAEVPPTGGWAPTRKWVGGLITGLASIAASWIITGAFDDVERGMAATLLTALATSYFVTNDDTPGGVPE